MKNIITDLYGADASARDLIPGVAAALKKDESIRVTLAVCREDEKYFLDYFSGEDHEDRVSIVPGDFKVCTNHDNPVKAAAPGAPYTITKAFRLLKEQSGEAALVTAGNTAAVIVLSLSAIGLAKQVTKPVLACFLPRFEKKMLCLLDCGANLLPTAQELLMFAQLGCAAMRKSCGVEDPKAALMCVGKEKGKGTPLLKEAYDLLEGSGLSFYGNAEPEDLFSSDVDVAVCDGLTGNMILKNTEATGLYLEQAFRKLHPDSKDSWESLKPFYSFNERGGAVVLGIRKPVIKAHGKAGADTIAACIAQAAGLA